MANKIQVKRSAVASKVPTTTDLDLGEIAINTYDGKMYIKKDNGTPSVVEIGGGGVSDGDKGDINVSNSGATWTIDAPVSVAKGGTGATSLTANSVLTGNGTSAITAETNFVCDDTGKVGIGTTTLSQTLNVNGTGVKIIDTEAWSVNPSSSASEVSLILKCSVDGNRDVKFYNAYRAPSNPFGFYSFDGSGNLVSLAKFSDNTGSLGLRNRLCVGDQDASTGFAPNNNTARIFTGNNGGGVCIGSTGYADYSGATAPANGLLVEGNVGIGTTSPTNLVSLGGNSARTVWMERHTTSNTAGNNLTVQSGGATSGATDKAGGNLVLSSGTATGTGASAIIFNTATAGTTGTTDRSPAEVARITGAGDIGIGTSSPSTQLHVVDSGASTSASTSVLRIESNPTGFITGNAGTTIDLATKTNTSGSTNVEVGTQINSVLVNSTLNAEMFDLRFWAMTSGFLIERLRLDQSGAVLTQQPAPATLNATGTLTIANLQKRIITSTTAAAVTGTLDTGANMDNGFNGPQTNTSLEWSVVNTGSTNSFTVAAAATGHTVVGNMVIAPGESGFFRSYKTGVQTWVTVRISSMATTLPVSSIELGHASDTTLSRSSAGILAVEGVTVPLNSITNTHTAQQIELGHASDTTLTRSAAGVLAVEGVNLAKVTDLVGQQTIWVPAGAMTANTTSGPASGSVETATNKVMLTSFDFDTTTQESAQFSIQMPKSWDLGTLICQFIWSHAATTTNFGVVWGISAVALADTNAGDTAYGTEVTVADTGGTTNAIYITAETTAVTVGNTPGSEEWVSFRVRRSPANASDTLAIDARLHGVKVHYTTNAATDS